MGTMAARTGTGNQKAALDTTLGKIAAYIPSEILALYLFMWGVANPSSTDKATPWALFWVSMGALVVYVVLNHALDRKDIKTLNLTRARDKQLPLPQKKRTLAVLVMAAAAFIAYAAALPQAPFLQVNSNANTIGAIAAAVLAVFLPMFGRLVGVTAEKK